MSEMERLPTPWHIYNGASVHMASTVHAEEAALVVSFLGTNATVYYEDKAVWEEGINGDGRADNSYDEFTTIVWRRAGLSDQPGKLRII